MPRQIITVLPCTGCGRCCYGASCSAAWERFRSELEAGLSCPALRFRGYRFRCGLIEDAQGKECEELKRRLKIGEGCCRKEEE